MIGRKCSLLAATYTSLSPVHVQSSTSLRRYTRHQPWCQEVRCSYATVADDSGEHTDERPTPRDHEHEWPRPPKGQPLPTPYQIFTMKHNASYSKARFYELVKVYHPDLSSGIHGDIPHAVKVERYRLIVAAHTILSDPVKRNAYDRFGAGWNGKAEVNGVNARHNGSSPGPFSHSWGDPSDPIWQNATWEDWERWHARKSGSGEEYTRRRAPVYMANSYFLAMVVALAMIGGSMNYGRAQDAGHYFVEQRDIVHDRSAKNLRRVRQETSSLNSRQDRIDFFVRQREATMSLSGYDEALREERANRVLPDQEVCRSEEVKEKDV